MKTKFGLSLAMIILMMVSSMISPLAPVNAAAANSREAVGGGNYPYLELLDSSNNGLRIQFEPPIPEITSRQVNGSTCQQVQIEGLLPSSELELPPLPVQGLMLGMPADAQPQVRILRVESVNLPGSFYLCPQDPPVLDPQTYGSDWQTPTQSIETKQDAFLPVEVLEFIETGFIRSQPYLQLRLNPVQYNPQSGEVKYVSRIEFEVDFGADRIQAGGSPEVIAEGEFEQQLEAQLFNYDQAIQWRVEPDRFSAFSAPMALANYDGNFYKVQVDQDGIIQLTYEKLLEAGLPVSDIDPNTFQLFDRGNPIALRQLDNGDALFESGESLLFYGQTLDGIYRKSNVYWLTWGGGNGLRMQTQPGNPVGGYEIPQSYQTTKHFELNKSYYSNKASGDLEDHWYWGAVFDWSPIAARQFKVNLGVLPEAGDSSIKVNGLISAYMGTPFNRAKVYLNGTLLGNVDMPPNTWKEFSFQDVPQSLLVAGENIIEIQTPLEDELTLNAVLVNWFEITYQDAYISESDQLFFDGDQSGSWQFQVDGFSTSDVEIYDLSDPTLPAVVSGFTIESSSIGSKLTFEATIDGESHYLAQTTTKRLTPTSIIAETTSSWGMPSNAADYLIISHANFITQAQTLASYRSGQGFLTAVIDVQDIYDEFNDGELSPIAIQDFLRFAYANWNTPKPVYLVLFGDGHFDYFNNYATNEINYVPAYLVDVDPFQGEVASDNRYAMVSGTDILPDLFVGRLPVRTTDEAGAVVQKIITYETTEPVEWNENLTFVADNADDAGQYATDTDAVISTYVPGNYSAEKIYFGITHSPAATVKTALLTAINEGRLIVHYAGHSGVQKWGDENFLALADVLALYNADKLPFVLPMTCLEGNFSYPSPLTNINKNASIGEAFVRKTSGGAIASWSPTGMGLHNGHMILEANLMDNLFNEYYNQVGYLTTAAKYHLFATTSGYRDLIDSYLLFGDPALRLQNIPVPLEAPSQLTAATVSWDKISLTWMDNSESETSFRIERSLDGETGWQQIAIVDSNLTTYTDTGLSELTSYYYRVRAFREGDLALSEFSNTAAATTLEFLDAPGNLAASVACGGGVWLNWQDNSLDESAFQLEKSPNGEDSWELLAELAPETTTYQDLLSPGTGSYYRVRAYRETDQMASEYSNTVFAVMNYCSFLPHITGGTP